MMGEDPNISKAIVHNRYLYWLVEEQKDQ